MIRLGLKIFSVKKAAPEPSTNYVLYSGLGSHLFEKGDY